MSNSVTGSAVILRPNEIPRSDRGGGAFTTPLVSRRVGATSFITGITEFGPGKAVDFHSHNCEESVVLLEGEAILDIDGQEHRLHPFDASWIPPNVVHRFRNGSKDAPMKLLWIYASPDATRTLENTGETRLVNSEHHASET
jgi:quercetin dioxygenase-like cupin family protein